MDVIIVRIYITESSRLLNTIVKYLKDDAKVRGISVFHAASGFGESGSITSSIVDRALDLPLSIEFFDTRDKITPALEHLSGIVKHEHIVYWDAKTND